MALISHRSKLKCYSFLPFMIMVTLLVALYVSYGYLYVVKLSTGAYMDSLVSEGLRESVQETVFELPYFISLHILMCFWFVALYQAMTTHPGTIPRKWNNEVTSDMKQNIKIKNFIMNMRKHHEDDEMNESLDVEIHGRLSLNPIERPLASDLNRNTAPNPSQPENEDSFEEAVDKLKKVELKEVFDKEEKRYCYNCHNFKPDRTHHCAQCNKCILKMDHHCLWIMNCVGFYNYKYFVLFLFYTNIILSLVLASTTKLVYDSLKNPSLEFGELIWLLTFYTLCLTILVILVFFLGFHVKMIINNKTTIEHCESKDSQYDTQSIYKNVCAVLGTNPLLWLIPARPNTTGEGISFPKKEAKALKTLS